jgi:hypothetical protein
MNIRRGLWRVWLVASFIWVVWTMWELSKTCVLGCKISDSLVIYHPAIGNAVLEALSVPIGLLLAAYLVRWVRRGFDFNSN